MKRSIKGMSVALAVVVLVSCVVANRCMFSKSWRGEARASDRRSSASAGNSESIGMVERLTRSETKPFIGIPGPAEQPHMMRSPYIYPEVFIDVKGLASGSTVACPATGKLITVPLVIERQVAEAKLDQTVLSELRMEKLTLPEAIWFLREQSVALDPEGEGIAMQIDEELLRESSPGMLEAQSVTLGLDNVPLGDALRYVTGLSGTRWRLDHDGITIVPDADYGQSLETRRYYVPALFEKLEYASEGVGSDEGRPSAIELLRSLGVVWVSDAEATYNAQRFELRVTCTENERSLVEAFVEVVLIEEAGLAEDGKNLRSWLERAGEGEVDDPFE